MIKNIQYQLIFTQPIPIKMLLTINRNSKITLFEQIFDQITRLIKSGTLEVGTRLPSTRELARITGVNRTTVVHVYEELWAQGYIESSPGSYTTVRHRQPVISIATPDAGDHASQQRVYRDNLDLQYDPIMHYLENGESIEKGKINFLQLAPDTRLLDRKQIKTSMKEIFKDKDHDPFDFTHARGYQPLRQEIVRHMNLHNINTEDKNVLITNGSLQSLQLIFQVFSKPGDNIVVENPTYSIILHFIKIYRLNRIVVPMTNEGMDLMVLEQVLTRKKVRFIYTMPTYQNPTGLSMPQNKREEFLQLCKDKDCIIIEDSTEEEMKYSGKTFLPVKSIDRIGQVIYLGTFTKVLAPGLRIGWIIATTECIKKLTVLKSIYEISSSTINQVFLCNFIQNGAYELHLRKTMRIFRKRMRTAISCIKRFIPPEKIEWTEPHGGYMIWLKLLTKPLKDIENYFSDFGVMVHNGKYFFADEQSNDYIRICIAQVDETEIEEGIKKTGEAIKALE